MKRFILTLHDQTVEVHCPDSVAQDVDVAFRHCMGDAPLASRHIVIREDEDNRYAISDDGELRFHGLTRGDLPTFLMEAALRALVSDMKSAVVLHAGVVAHKDKSILVAGGTGSGKSSLVAWLVDNGFTYITDEVAVLVDGKTQVLGMPRALVLKPGAAEQVQEFATFRGGPSVPAGMHVMMRPAEDKVAASRPRQCALIIFPRFVPDASIRIDFLTAAQTGLKLVECNLNARNLADDGFVAITRLARQVPALSIEYGYFEDLRDRLDAIARIAAETELDAPSLRRFFSSFARAPEPAKAAPAAKKQYAIPSPTPRRDLKKKLTIGMATYDDYDGAYFSIQALRLYHPEVLDDTELLLIDNHPDGPCAEALKALETSIPNYRYVPRGDWSGTTIKQAVFDEAIGDSVLCIDSHVFIVQGAVKRLLDYLEANEASKDLLQGPLIYDDLVQLASHFQPGWSGGMYGTWAKDERASDPDGPPFEIPMQGMGLFACRRAAWPGFNPRFRGFGGEEGYIHEKVRRQGGRTLCLPFLRWMHRFNRPMGLPYANTWEDRVRNYIIGLREFGFATSDLESHFRELLGPDVANRIYDEVDRELREERPS